MHVYKYMHVFRKKVVGTPFKSPVQYNMRRWDIRNDYRFISWWRHQMEHFPRYWHFVRGIHRLPANSSHKGQWGGASMFSLICDWTNGWVNNWDTGDLRRHRSHYDVNVMIIKTSSLTRVAYTVHLYFPILWRGKPILYHFTNTIPAQHDECCAIYAAPYQISTTATAW